MSGLAKVCRLAGMVSVSALSLAFHGVAWAAADNAGTGDQAAKAATNQEIIVTAGRQQQSIQKVAAAVQVFTGDDLRASAVYNVGQVFGDTPSINVTAQPAGGFSVNVRAQGGDLPSCSSQGAVALEFDGVYNILSLGTLIGFFDTARIEASPGRSQPAMAPMPTAVWSM